MNILLKLLVHSSYVLVIRGDMWHLTCDTLHKTPDMWHMTYDMSHVTCVIWHTGGDEHCLTISGPYLLWFGCEGVLKILNKRRTTDWMKELINKLINDKCVCRTAPATPGLIITHQYDDQRPCLCISVKWSVVLWSASRLSQSFGSLQIAGLILFSK